MSAAAADGAAPPGAAIVIGAGVVGLSAARALQKKGFAVTVIDRKGVAAEASAGNAGAFAFTDVVPLATPGIMRKAPKWLLDPLGPLSIPPRYALAILPWMLRFWRASRRDRYDAAFAAQASLMALSAEALRRQIDDISGEDLLLREGQLQLYDDAASFEASMPQWEARRAHGVRYALLRRPEEIAEIQPGLSERFRFAGYTPDWINTSDPKAWTRRIAERFVADGGRIETSEITDLTATRGGAQVIDASGARRAGVVIIAAGAWSHRLTRRLGDRPPLETERGYNTTLPPGAFDLRTHVTFADHGFVASRIRGGVRIGGAVEFGGLAAPPNYRRSAALLRKAQTFMPSLDPSGGVQWMGFRPSLPDSLPIIGPASSAPRVFYAFGHGHLGLTQAAATAELVAALVAGAPPPVDPRPFRAQRF